MKGRTDPTNLASPWNTAVSVAAPLVALAVAPLDFVNTRGLLYFVLGEAALLLAGFSPHDIASAFRQAAGGLQDGGCRPSRIFEAVARNSLALGVLAILVSCIQTILSFSGVPIEFAARLAGASVPFFWGVVLASLAGVAASSARGRETLAAPETSEAGANGGAAGGAGHHALRLTGHALMAVILCWMVGSGPGPIPLLGQPQAWLLVLGGTLFLSLIHGRLGSGRGLTLGFALSALIGGIRGVLQALHAFSTGRIELVAEAIWSIPAVWFIGLAGMLLFGFPLEDRAARRQEPGTLGRVAWYGAPLAALLFLLIVILMVITPMEKRM